MKEEKRFSAPEESPTPAQPKEPDAPELNPFYQPIAGRSEFSYLFENPDDELDDPYDYVSKQVQAHRATQGAPDKPDEAPLIPPISADEVPDAPEPPTEPVIRDISVGEAEARPTLFGRLRARVRAWLNRPASGTLADTDTPYEPEAPDAAPESPKSDAPGDAWARLSALTGAAFPVDAPAVEPDASAVEPNQNANHPADPAQSTPAEEQADNMGKYPMPFTPDPADFDGIDVPADRLPQDDTPDAPDISAPAPSADAPAQAESASDMEPDASAVEPNQNANESTDPAQSTPAEKQADEPGSTPASAAPASKTSAPASRSQNSAGRPARPAKNKKKSGKKSRAKRKAARRAQKAAQAAPKPLQIHASPQFYDRPENEIVIPAAGETAALVRGVYRKAAKPIRRRQKRAAWMQKMQKSARLIRQCAAESIAARRARHSGGVFKRLLAALTPSAIFSRVQEEGCPDRPGTQHRRSLLVQSAVTAGLALALTALSVCTMLALPVVPAAIARAASPRWYAAIHAAALLAAAALCHRTVLGGVLALVRGSTYAGADGLVGLTVFAALIQSAVAVFRWQPVQAGAVSLYAAIALWTLSIHTAGKLLWHRRLRLMQHWFRTAQAPETVRLLREDSALQQEVDAYRPNRLTVFAEPGCDVARFTAAMEEPDGSPQRIFRLTLPTLAAAVICGAAAGWAVGSVDAALAAFTAALCVITPATAAWCMGLPLLRFTRQLLPQGAAVASWTAVNVFGETGCALLCDSSLFPDQTLRLEQVRAMQNGRVDLSVVEAAAVLRRAGGPMRGLFDRMIRGDAGALPRAEQVQTGPDGGITGVVNGRRVVIGNGGTLRANGIEPPSRDYERMNCPPDKRFAYLAVDGVLSAMFVMDYGARPDIADAMQEYAENGGDTAVLSVDPNITAPFIAHCFALPEPSVQVIAADAAHSPEPEPVGDASLIVADARAMFRALTACVRAKPGFQLASALQLAGMVFGLLLVLIFSLTGAVVQLHTPVLMLFNLFWIAAVIFIPFVKKD